MNRKSHLASLVLTFIFGPFGLLYASAWQAVVLIMLKLVMFGLGYLNGVGAVWLLSIVLGIFAVRERNQEVSRQEELEEQRHQELLQATIRAAASRRTV